MEGENTTNQNTQQTSEQTQTAHTTPTVSAPATAGEKNTLMAILSYIGILVIVPYLTAKEDPFVKFHIKQGLVLVVIEIAVFVLMIMTMGILYPVLILVNIATLILSIIGIINAVQGNEKELPLVGNYAKHFNV